MRDRIAPIVTIVVLLAIWQLVCTFGAVPDYLLPSPIETIQAFFDDFPLLMKHAGTTLLETAYGLAFGIVLSFAVAMVMDRIALVKSCLYPLLIITQTVPIVAIAPLLILWLGYGILPKVVLIVILTFFPMVVNLLDGFAGVDADEIRLFRTMGAGEWQIMRYVKLPSALPSFFSGLRIAAAYSLVGAVIAEWLGGFSGLGVYMVRVKATYSYDKMFAVIFLITIISLVLIWFIKSVERACMPWRRAKDSTASTSSKGESDAR